MSLLRLVMGAGALVLAAISITAHGQSEKPDPGATANREYAAVFAHPDNPCSANYATLPYMQCMDKELSFIEPHMAAFVEALRGLELKTR